MTGPGEPLQGVPLTHAVVDEGFRNFGAEGDVRIRSEKVITNEKYLDINWYPIIIRSDDTVEIGTETIDMPFGLYKTRRKFCAAFNKMHIGKFEAVEMSNRGSILLRKVSNEE